MMIEKPRVQELYILWCDALRNNKAVTLNYYNEDPNIFVMLLGNNIAWFVWEKLNFQTLLDLIDAETEYYLESDLDMLTIKDKTSLIDIMRRIVFHELEDYWVKKFIEDLKEEGK